MEETSYERRSLRLMEMGFPSPEEAVSVYRHAVPGKLLNQGMIREKTPVITKHLHMLPSVYLDQFSPGQSLLLQALHGAPEEMRERLCYEMIYLANKIVMADYKPLNDSDGLRTSMEKASSLVNLGLGVAMREKGAQARDILASMNAETLFSLGFNMVLEQQRRLKLLLQDIERSMIPERFRDLTDGLLQKRPRYKDAEFSLVEELDEVTHASDQLEDMAAIMARLDWERLIPELGGTNTGSGMDMETVILTALAVNSLSRVTAFRPLSRDELVSFLSSATRLKGSRRTLQDAFRKDLPAFLSGIGQAGVPGRSASLAQNLAARLEEETGGIRDLSRIDPRFTTCLCVRL